VNFMDLCKTYDPISFDDHYVCWFQKNKQQG
jgi:hypothetical protein